MDAASTQPQERATGPALLLAHCATLELVGQPRRRAVERLEDAVGREFARLLLRSLTGGGGLQGDLAA